MGVEPSLTDNLVAFLRALSTHWVALAICALLMIEAVFSPFRPNKAPEGQRMVVLSVAGFALMVAAFQAFSDEHLAARQANKSIESYNNVLQSDRRQADSERDNLRSQLSTLQKQLAESRAVAPTAQPEDGSQQHPFSDKAKCPPGLAIVNSDQSGDSGRQPSGRDRVCFVSTPATEARGGKRK